MKWKIIITDPQIMGGTPVIQGTRVPVQTFIDYLESGYSLEDFVEGFPTVSKKKVVAFLEEVRENFLAKA